MIYLSIRENKITFTQPNCYQIPNTLMTLIFYKYREGNLKNTNTMNKIYPKFSLRWHFDNDGMV